MQVYNRPKDPKHQSKFVPRAKAAAMLGVHPATVGRWAEAGLISYIRGESEAAQRRFDVNSYGLELVPGRSPRPGVFLGIPDRKRRSNNPLYQSQPQSIESSPTAP
jgi:hypothetical protein